MVEIGGTHISYFFICQTKLWYFSRHIQMEHSSDLVSTGRFIHENMYERERKEIQIDGIAIDFIRKGDGTIELHEIKKSQKMELAHEMQAKYYLYCLKKKGITAVAIIDYPITRERKRIELNLSDEAELEKIIEKVHEINALETPKEPERKPFCPKCSYYELCWSE